MTALAIFSSLIGIWVLAEHDPKRRRVFGLPPSQLGMKRSKIWALTLLPGLICACFLSTVAFTFWCAITCTLGWVVVAITPNQYAAMCTEGRKIADKLTLTALSR